MKTLREFVGEYVRCRDLAPSSAEQLTCFCNCFDRWHVTPITLSDLRHETINDWLGWMREKGYSPETRRNRRRMFLTLAMAAADDGLISPIMRRKIKPIAVPARCPIAWTTEQAKALLAACSRLSGVHAATGLRRTLYWRSYVLAAWDTGLRGCDLRRLRIDAVLRSGGSLLHVQTKTGKRVVVHLRPVTLDAIHASVPPRRELCWPLWGRLELFRRESRRLVRMANLPGSLKCLRSGSGTAVERQSPGRGHEHLGNTRRVFEASYLDVRQIEDHRPLPPPIA